MSHYKYISEIRTAFIYGNKKNAFEIYNWWLSGGSLAKHRLPMLNPHVDQSGGWPIVAL